jgi:pyruvate/2-oxoacid:ferredoxin oxidoreductase alpha subunit
MRAEARAELFLCDDADVVIVACNTPARMAKAAVQELRAAGVRAGLFRPQTLWPFPVDAFLPLLTHAARIVVVEASPGQLEDELRLALSHASARGVPEIESVRHYGGILPQHDEIVAKVRSASEVRA